MRANTVLLVAAALTQVPAVTTALNPGSAGATTVAS